jgi:5-methylcytosine-specific restriction endonuclease McrBC GTP-binding regulatory subunit McrB
MNNTQLYDIKNDFLKEWPVERLETMTLEEYTNLDKTSFCYWIEHVTSTVGSIKGGSSYKFGIYRMNASSQTEPANNRTNNEKFAWHTKYGATQEEAFQSIKTIIIQVIRFSQENNLKPLDNIDLGDAYKWKIAFLYGNFNIINIFNIDSLNRIALGLGLVSKETNTISELNYLILKQKPGSEDFFDFSHRIWNTYGKENDRVKSFEKWLKLVVKTDSGTISSYLRALEILEDHFKINVYSEDNIDLLKELYEDLKIHQKVIDGKYYFSKAKSYGVGGFYSAAVNSYIDFYKEYSANIKTIISSKFKKLIHDFDAFIKEGHTILNKFEINHNYFSNYYVFYWDSHKIIGDKIVHYEIIERENKVYVEVHFEGSQLQRDLFSNSIKTLPENIVTYNYKSKNLRFNESYSYDDIDILPKLANALIYLEENLGDQLRSIKNETPNNNETSNSMNDKPLNQILFGPPGTGKTFNSINEALQIVDGNYFETHKNDRKKLTERFKELLINNWEENKGQIAFCTFHQSFSYEDFVEGIKPKTSDSKSVYYDIESGVFKRICQLAESNNSTVKVIKEGNFSWDDEQFNNASFYKLSLGAIYNPQDKPIYEYCRDNGYIAIGFGEENDFTGMSETEIIEKCKELQLEPTSGQQLNYFIHNIKNNNYVIIGNGNKYVRAIGKVVGDYEYVADSPIRYNHFRKVEWLFVDANIPIEELYEKGLSQKTLYKIDESALKKDFFTNKGQQEVIDVKEDKKYVLIIDEINRGNVSSIFGELITLIEKDKRAGSLEELEITLPYSKETFKVPKNVYIIGTMNTADRSIEVLDTALRRRFSFKEFAPKPELIRTEGLSGALKGIVNSIDLALLLDTINTRIEKLIDKDHKIGHSYLLKVNSEETLKSSFRNEIIPLLEEYFFGDYGKIGLVLGSTFVEKVNHDFNFASFDDYDADIQSDLKEKKVFRIATETNWDFSKI